MNKVVISGFYGFHNIGDEAILKTLTQQLRKLDPNVEITVLSHSPEETMSKFGVKAINRRDAFKVFNAIRKSKILLSGGGSLLQDDTSARSIHYYLAILRMGLFLRKKVFLISNGIGPLIRESNKRQVARVLNKVDHTTVRDDNSRQLLEDIGVDPAKITVSADLVIAMDLQPKEIGNKILMDLGIIDDSRKRLAIAIRQKDFRTEEKREQLIKLANTLAEKHSVIFIPFYYKNDTKIYEDIHEYTDSHVYFIIEKYNSDEFMSILQNIDILVGSRLHSLIFSLVAEIPFIGISYDPKIESFMDMISMKPICTMATFSEERIVEAVRELEENYESKKQDVLNAKQLLRTRLDLNEIMLKKVL
ncbi:polysaccharide pyruvyl transferase CsaB [Fusibacter bizertensis]